MDRVARSVLIGLYGQIVRSVATIVNDIPVSVDDNDIQQAVGRRWRRQNRCL